VRAVPLNAAAEPNSGVELDVRKRVAARGQLREGKGSVLLTVDEEIARVIVAAVLVVADPLRFEDISATAFQIDEDVAGVAAEGADVCNREVAGRRIDRAPPRQLARVLQRRDRLRSPVCLLMN
jgi:hypothetical protein